MRKTFFFAIAIQAVLIRQFSIFKSTTRLVISLSFSYRLQNDLSRDIDLIVEGLQKIGLWQRHRRNRSRVAVETCVLCHIRLVQCQVNPIPSLCHIWVTQRYEVVSSLVTERGLFCVHVFSPFDKCVIIRFGSEHEVCFLPYGFSPLIILCRKVPENAMGLGADLRSREPGDSRERLHTQRSTSRRAGGLERDYCCVAQDKPFSLGVRGGAVRGSRPQALGRAGKVVRRLRHPGLQVRSRKE